MGALIYYRKTKHMTPEELRLLAHWSEALFAQDQEKDELAQRIIDKARAEADAMEDELEALYEPEPVSIHEVTDDSD